MSEMDISGFEQRVRDRAYALWLSEGCPHGRDAEHWRLSEEEETRAELDKVGPAISALKAKVAPKKAAAKKPAAKARASVAAAAH